MKGNLQLYQQTGEKIKSFDGHTDLVTSICVSNGMLFSGSSDRTIRQWNTKSGECLRTYKGHTKGINGLFVSGSFLYSGSDDKKCRKWDVMVDNVMVILTVARKAIAWSCLKGIVPLSPLCVFATRFSTAVVMTKRSGFANVEIG